MTDQIILTVPARLLETGDHTAGFTIYQMHNFPDGSKEIGFLVPGTTHKMTGLIDAKDLDAVLFPLTKRGDAHRPSARNLALGLPEDLHRPGYNHTPPEPIAVYPAGTRVGDIKHFDRGMKVVFECPLHHVRYYSKDPYVSNWFGGGHATADLPCEVQTGDYLVAEDYLPTRNG